MKIVTIFLSLICSNNTLRAQILEYANRSDFTLVGEPNNTLLPLGSDLLLEDLQFVGEVYATNRSLKSIYYDMHHAATDIGANVYRVVEYKTDTLDQPVYSRWALYYADSIILNTNYTLLNENRVYVFGLGDQPTSVKVNGIKILIEPEHYFSDILKHEEVLKINKGGLSGVTFTFRKNDDNRNSYIITGSGSLAPGVSATGGAGISFSTGNLIMLEPEYGRFLSVIFKNAIDR